MKKIVLTEAAKKKLPPAAKNYIQALEATVERLNREIASSSGPSDSNIFYHAGVGNPRGLPEDCVVSLRLVGGRIDLYASEDKQVVAVRGHGLDAKKSLCIRPTTANTFEVSF